MKNATNGTPSSPAGYPMVSLTVWSAWQIPTPPEWRMLAPVTVEGHYCCQVNLRLGWLVSRLLDRFAAPPLQAFTLRYTLSWTGSRNMCGQRSPTNSCHFEGMIRRFTDFLSYLRISNPNLWISVFFSFVIRMVWYDQEMNQSRSFSGTSAESVRGTEFHIISFLSIYNYMYVLRIQTFIKNNFLKIYWQGGIEYRDIDGNVVFHTVSQEAGSWVNKYFAHILTY